MTPRSCIKSASRWVRGAPNDWRRYFIMFGCFGKRKFEEILKLPVPAVD